MLQNLMELKLFVYGMVGLGGFSVLLMLIMNKVSSKNVADKESYQKVARRLRRTTLVTGIGCAALIVANTVGTFQLNYNPAVRYEQILIGIGVILGMICVERLLEFSMRERLTSSFILDYMDDILMLRSRDKPIVTRELDVLDQKLDGDLFNSNDPTVLESLDSVKLGIRETAAAKPKYGKYLTPEEEQIMKDVIKEYMT